MTPCDTLLVSKAEPDQSRFWTDAEYLALDQTDSRFELIDGRLFVTPPATNAHDDIAVLIRNAIQAPARAAAGLRTFPTPELRLKRGSYVVPDLAVGRFRYDARTNDAADAVLVVEVTSPSNANHDRKRKKRLYAEAGIPWYLLVEPDFADYASVTLYLYRLDGDRYVEHAVAKQGEELVLEGLHNIVLDTDEIVDP